MKQTTTTIKCADCGKDVRVSEKPKDTVRCYECGRNRHLQRMNQRKS